MPVDDSVRLRASLVRVNGRQEKDTIVLFQPAHALRGSPLSTCIPLLQDAAFRHVVLPAVRSPAFKGAVQSAFYAFHIADFSRYADRSQHAPLSSQPCVQM